MELHPASLRAVARSRTVGLHFWGQVLGLTVLDATEGAPRMRLEPESTALDRGEVPELPADLTALATLADVSLGFAIRRTTGVRDLRLATTSLAYQQVAPAYGAVTSHAEVVSTDGHQALAQTRLTDDAGRLVGQAQAWFLVLEVPEGRTLRPMPAEQPAGSVPVVGDDDLDEAERAAAETATTAAHRALTEHTPLARELLGLEWTSADDETVTGTALIGPHLGNRVGDVQGGAVLGMATTAGDRLAGPGMRLSDVHVQYLRPGRGTKATVTAGTVRRGRAALFAEAEIEVDGRLTTTAQLTYLTADSSERS